MHRFRRKRTTILLASMILTWVVSIGGIYSFWRFYPKQDVWPFPDPGMLEEYENWVPPEIGPIDLVTVEGDISEVRKLMPGLYYSRSSDGDNVESLLLADISTGKVNVLADIDRGEHILVMKSDAKHRFLAVWTTFGEEESKVVRFRLYDALTGSWRLFSTSGETKPWVYLEPDNIYNYFSKEVSYFELKGRYFASRLYESRGGFFNGHYLVFDSEKEDFFTFKAIHGYHPNQPAIQALNRESGTASFWAFGNYFLPQGRGIRGWANYPGLSADLSPEGYIKKCDVDLTSGNLRCSENIDLPIFIWDLLFLNDKELLLTAPNPGGGNRDNVFHYKEGRLHKLDTSFYSGFMHGNVRVTEFRKLNTLMFEVLDRVSNDNEQEGERIIRYDLTTDGWEEIAYIPKEFFLEEFCIVPSQDAGVFCCPLVFEESGEDDGSANYYTECRFYDVAGRKNAATLRVEGKIGAACLLLDEDSPLPSEGEVVVAHE